MLNVSLQMIQFIDVPQNYNQKEIVLDLFGHNNMKFKLFDFVWAKVHGHHYWPAVIVEPGKNTPRKPPRNYGTEMYWVLFFGTHEYAWVAEGRVKEYRANKDFFASKTRGASFKYSIMEIEEHIEKAERDPSYYFNFKLTRKPKAKRRTKTPASHVVDNNVIEINENLPPAETCYGVLGTGTIGTTVVNSLIKVAKKVYIWNGTNKKCDKILEKLDYSDRSNVKICLSPRIVMQHSHIIFNCVSDCQVSETIIERTLTQSVATKFMQGKGLVDMSGVDPNTTKKLSDLVKDSGGKYLEVRIQHGKKEGIGGGYLFLVGGSKDLFTACENCFYSLGGTPVHFGEEAGYVTKMNLVLQLIKSVCLVGLTEGFSLFERIIPQDIDRHVLDIIELSPFASDYVTSKAKKIFRKNYTLVEQSMQNLGRDIRLGMEMSNYFSEPMLMATLVDQIFKHCQKLGYGELDPSAIFMRIRH